MSTIEQLQELSAQLDAIEQEMEDELTETIGRPLAKLLMRVTYWVAGVQIWWEDRRR